jgi:serine/threonine-protein kinase
VLVATEIPRAIELFEQALAADPAFALAAAMLANSHIRMYYYAPDRSQARLDSAKAAAERALALQPGLGEAHLALAMYHYWGHRDYAAATEQLRLARQALPNSADIETQAAAIARRQGRWDEAIAGFQKATLLDPRSSFGLDQLGLTYQGCAATRKPTARSSAPWRSRPMYWTSGSRTAVNSVLWKGDVAPLRAALGSLAPGSDAEIGNRQGAWWVAWLARDFAAAGKVVASDAARGWGDLTNNSLPPRFVRGLDPRVRGKRRAGRPCVFARAEIATGRTRAATR